MNLKKLAISQLTFLILSNETDKLLKKEAEMEIRRRFHKTGYIYDALMEHEEVAFNLRKDNIDNYLIGNNPDSQLFMEVYFNYVHNKSLFEHGNLLFSELLLCNSKNDYGFIKKVIGLEKDNVAKLLGSYDYDYTIDYKGIYIELSERYYNKTIGEDSYIDLMTDISEGSSFINEKDAEAAFKYKNNLIGLSKKGRAIFLSMISEIEKVDNINMLRFVFADYNKLIEQRRKIINSFKNDTVDYSFYNEEEVKRLKRAKY